MAFILTNDLHRDALPDAAFAKYREYLESIKDRLPPGLSDIIGSAWYFDWSDHRAPHDARLVKTIIAETPVEDERQERSTSITIRLLNAAQDGYIEYRYIRVNSYRLELLSDSEGSAWGLRDWRYDEFRLGNNDLVEHEIEWWGPVHTGTWFIESQDVQFSWSPR